MIWNTKSIVDAVNVKQNDTSGLLSPLKVKAVHDLFQINNDATLDGDIHVSKLQSLKTGQVFEFVKEKLMHLPFFEISSCHSHIHHAICYDVWCLYN